MRVTLFFVLLALFTGCSSSPKKDSKAAQTQPAPKKKKEIKATVLGASQPQNTSSSRQALQPAQSMRGRISAVREDLQFVVIDFGNNKMPPLDQRLNVYRIEQKVAEIKVTGPYLGTTVAADILKGEAKFGDVVKPN